MRFPALVALLGAVLLAACGGPPAATIAEAEIALTAAERVALAYVVQPACPAGTVALTCSDAATVMKIKVTANAAYQAIKAAKAGSVTPEAAMAAVQALAAIVPAKQ